MKITAKEYQCTTSNAKLQKLAVEHGIKHKILVFGMTAGATCPSADTCKTGFKTDGSKRTYCFGMQGAYLWPAVREKYAWRHKMSKRHDWVDRMVAELHKRKSRHVRIHDIGDFYSDEYLYKWLCVMDACPDHKFWCYTKEVKRFKRFRLKMDFPRNFHYAYSYGGKDDALIDREHDRYSEVIDADEALHLDTTKHHDLTHNELQLLDNTKRRFYTVAH